MIQQQRQPEKQPDFHGAALVDEHGREIPITEDMVQQALEALADTPISQSAHPAG